MKLASGQPSVKLQLFLFLNVYQTFSGIVEVILLACEDKAKKDMDETQLYTKKYQLSTHVSIFRLKLPDIGHRLGKYEVQNGLDLML